MIKRLYVDNFKSLVNFELNLAPLTLILGANGAGKSTVLHVLSQLRKFVGNEGTTTELFPTGTLTRWETRFVQTFEVDIDGNGGLYKYCLEINHEAERQRTRLQKEELWFREYPLYRSDGTEAQLYRDGGREGPKVLCDWIRSGPGIIQERRDNTELTWFKERMNGTWVVHLDPRAMGSASRDEHSAPNDDLSNFASWFRHLSQDQQSEVFALTKVLREEVLDGFDYFRLKTESEKGRVLIARFRVEPLLGPPETAVEFLFDELSDGQRALIALYALTVCSLDGEKTLCIDQPENFVALPEIQPWLVRLMERTSRGQCQALLISQHPELIDLLAARTGYWMERRGGGPTRLRPIQTEDREGMSLSELIARGWIHA
jgi:predicted ATPase